MHYHDFVATRTKLTAYQVQERAARFLALRTLEEMAKVLKTKAGTLRSLSRKPQYESFYLPKPQGGYRLIQAPRQPLKGHQDRLGRYWQWVYYRDKPAASFGFVIAPADEEHPSNIYTNALLHQGQKWVLNLDLKSFFHQISQATLEQLFLAAPFSYSPELAQCLAGLCTFEGRLPMGAPSSPVLSNFAARPLDQRLSKLAKAQDWRYSRYADDLTISSPEKITASQMGLLREQIEASGFTVNTKKLKLQHRKDPPEITGLILQKSGPDVSPAFVAGIKSDLKVLQALVSPRMVQRGIFSRKPVKKLRASIQGQLNFLQFVRGEDDPELRKLQKKLRQSVRRQ